MGWNRRQAVENKKGLEKLFCGLLGMKAHSVPGNRRRCQIVFDIQKVVFGLGQPRPII